MWDLSVRACVRARVTVCVWRFRDAREKYTICIFIALLREKSERLSESWLRCVAVAHVRVISLRVTVSWHGLVCVCVRVYVCVQGRQGRLLAASLSWCSVNRHVENPVGVFFWGGAHT